MAQLRWILSGLLVFLCMGYGDVAAQSGWRLQPVPLQTRWAKNVSPTHAWPEYPRPQMVRAHWVNLNGLWDYAITAQDASRPERFNGKILVPYPIESALSGVQRTLLPTKRLWYRRTFTRPATRPGDRVLVHFGAVDWQATVYVNGTAVGQHQGGYQSFSFDITDALKPGDATNELAVAVWDPTDVGDNPAGKQTLWPRQIYYTAASGIWQTVWLETVPAVSIAGLELTPDIDAGVLRVRVYVSNDADGYTVQVAAVTDTGVVSSVAGKPGDTLDLAVPRARLWSPADPFLYDLSIRLLRQDTVVDSVGSYFGMRKIEVKPDSAGVERIFLNNQYTYNLGVLDQGYWPDGLYTAPTDAALRFDIAAIKAMGFNTIRKHIKVEPARWYYHADRLGMLVWQDLVQPKRSLAARAIFEAEAYATVRQLRNYPSIVMWVLFNEGWGEYDQARLTQWLKRQDPSRLVNGHSGGYINRPPPEGADHKWVASDVTDIHAYPDPAMPPAHSGKARVLGEFGGVGASVPGHQWNDAGSWGYVTTSPAGLITTYDSMITRLERLETAGLSGSIYTEPFDVETEENGLLTYDRAVIKIPLATLRAMNARLLPAPSGSAVAAAELPVRTAEPESTPVTYAALLEQYEQGRNDPDFVRALARRARAERDTENAAKLGAVVIKGLRDVYTPDNIRFMRDFTRRSTNPGFALFYRQSAKIDQVMGEPGYADAVVDDVITTEEISPLVFPGGGLGGPPSTGEPDWAVITAVITKKYGAAYAERTIGRAQVFWYWHKRRWFEFHKSLIAFVAKYGFEHSGVSINHAAWSLFEHSTDEAQLTTAASWMEEVYRRAPGDYYSLDTYANLLYKLGRVAEGIAWEKKALAIATATNDRERMRNFQEILEKMSRGEPTWPVE